MPAQEISHNECSCADRFPVFRNVLLLHFSPVVGMYRTDIPPYIYDTEDGYTYPQNQQHHIFHSTSCLQAFFKAMQRTRANLAVGLSFLFQWN